MARTQIAVNEKQISLNKSFRRPEIEMWMRDFVRIERMRTMRRNAIDTPTCRTIIIMSKFTFSDEIIATMTKPTTSSIIAAVVSRVPTLVAVNLEADRVANVAPNDVDDKAAPAAKAVNRPTFVG